MIWFLFGAHVCVLSPVFAWQDEVLFQVPGHNQDNENTSQCNETATQAQLVGKTIRMRLPYKTLMIVGNCRLFHQILDMMYYIYIYSYRYHIVVPVLWQEFLTEYFCKTPDLDLACRPGETSSFWVPVGIPCSFHRLPRQGCETTNPGLGQTAGGLRGPTWSPTLKSWIHRSLRLAMAMGGSGGQYYDLLGVWVNLSGVQNPPTNCDIAGIFCKKMRRCFGWSWPSLPGWVWRFTTWLWLDKHRRPERDGT